MIGVYGANGFIGRHVVEGLLSEGHAVRAVARKFDQRQADAWQDRVEMVEADFTNSLATLASVQGLQTVIQLVSSSSPGMGNRALVEDIRENVISHVSFLRDVVDAGVQRYVFISSGGTVYGPNAAVPTPETAHTNPISSHGMTKLVIEKYLEMFSRVHGLQYTTLRVSNPYGPGQIFRKGQGLVPLILQRNREGRPIQIFGDGSSQRDYIYISDLCAAVIKATQAPGAANQILNIGKGEGTTILEMVATIESCLGRTLDKEFLPPRNTDVSRSILDISKARQVLSWSPQVSLQEGIARMLTSSS